MRRKSNFSSITFVNARTFSMFVIFLFFNRATVTFNKRFRVLWYVKAVFAQCLQFKRHVLMLGTQTDIATQTTCKLYMLWSHATERRQ